MANQALLTTQAKMSAALQTYFALTATLPALQSPTIPLTTLYAFLSRSNEWIGLTEPPSQDVAFLKQSQKNMIAAKRINSADISMVTQRIDWISGTVYDEYSDTVDMFSTDTAGNLNKFFYVKNSFDQVFKCLSNNAGAESTVEPFFQPGQYNTQNIFQGEDGYKWKFMFTVDIGSKIKFMDSNWIPVPIGFNVPNSFQTAEGCGGIEVINVTNGGTGFSNSNVISVVITGDGTGATASVNGIDGSGSIVDVQVTNPGTNYTFTNVQFVSASGTGATVNAPTSPVGGHGFDPISELGCKNLMVSVEFDGDEALSGVSYLPTDIKYYQMGLTINPTDAENFPNSSNTTIFKTTTDLQVSQGIGAFQFDELAYQSTDGTYTNRFWEGTVVHFDADNNVISTINTIGSPVTGAQIYGQTSTTTRTLLTVTTPNYDLFSGYVIYIQNLDGVTRSSDGIEQFKIVLGH